MSFRKLSSYGFNQENGGQFVSPSSVRIGSFEVSDHTFTSATEWAAFGVSVIIAIPLLLRIPLQLRLNDGDLQALSQITAALTVFMLAVPLFLRDLHKGSNFWRQFFWIAFTLLLATAAGVVAFLRNSGELPLSGSFWLGLAVIATIQLTSVPRSFLRLANIELQSNFFLTAVLSITLLGLSSYFTTGDWVTILFLLLSLYGFYLTLVLFVAILLQIYRNSQQIQPDYTNQLLMAIARLAMDNRDHAITEQELLRRLKREAFPDTPEIVSADLVNRLVTEMDADPDRTHPLVTI